MRELIARWLSLSTGDLQEAARDGAAEHPEPVDLGLGRTSWPWGFFLAIEQGNGRAQNERLKQMALFKPCNVIFK